MQMDQLRDLIGLHCSYGVVEHNGVVLLLFFIRLIIIQVYTSQKSGLGLVIFPSDMTRFFFSLFYFC